MSDVTFPDNSVAGPAPAISVQALRQWEDSDRDFARAFRFQYLVTRDELKLPGFITTPVGRWTVMSGSDLPLCHLQDIAGRPVGVSLGIAVAATGLLREVAQLPFDSEDPDFFDRFEMFLIDVAGRYGFALHVAGQTRFYTDPVGMIGAVHEAGHHRLAASPLLAIDRPMIANPKFDTRLIEEHGGKYSLFHTADRDVKRLNPNCYLDLGNFTEHRFWPRDERFATDDTDHDALYDEIARVTSFNIGQIASNFETALPLSGGNDSRLLAAMGGEHLPKIGQIFTHVHNYSSRIDSAVAREMARVLNVPLEIHDHHKINIRPKMLRQAKRFFAATIGSKTPLPRELTKGVNTALKDGAVVMRGHQTDLLRAVYVHRLDKREWDNFDWQIKSLLIVPRNMFSSEVSDRFHDDFARWRSTLPLNAMEKAVDFMFLEIYYSATIGSTFPALWRNFYLSPFNSRRLIDLSLRFDDTYRRKCMPVHDLTTRLNPALAAVPYDNEIGSPPDLKRLRRGGEAFEIAGKRVELTKERLQRAS